MNFNSSIFKIKIIPLLPHVAMSQVCVHIMPSVVDSHLGHVTKPHRTLMKYVCSSEVFLGNLFERQYKLNLVMFLNIDFSFLN